MSNSSLVSYALNGDVDLYIKNVELFMLIHQTHNSEKGVLFLCSIQHFYCTLRYNTFLISTTGLAGGLL